MTRHTASLFSNDSRGQVEVLSHTLIFMVIIMTAGGTVVAGSQVIEETKDMKAVEQTTRGYISIHEKAKQITTIGSENKYATSGLTSQIKLESGTLTRGTDTTITITEHDGGTHTLTSTPLHGIHNPETVYYDAGVISEVHTNTNESTLHWSPIDNYKSNDGVLPITTITLNSSFETASGDFARIFITQERQPETVMLQDGAEIQVQTTTPHGWGVYLDKYEFLNVTSVTRSGDTYTIQADVKPGSNNNVLVQHQAVHINKLDS